MDAILLNSNLPLWMQLVCGFSTGGDGFPTGQNQPAQSTLKREAWEQQTTDVTAALAWEQETCLQQKGQGSAAHRKPHHLSEVGVCPALHLHSVL